MRALTQRFSNKYLRENLSLAWPLALNALLTQSMLIIDTLLVSPLGEIPLAAMGIAGTIIAFFLGLQIAFANGSQLIVGKAFGARDKNGLIQALFNGTVISVSAALVFILLLSSFDQQLANILTDDAELALQVVKYLSIAKFILLFNALTQSYTAFLNGQGNTRTALYSYMVELPLNTLISYLLIFGFKFSIPLLGGIAVEGKGLEGAALGSFIAILIRAGILTGYIKFNFSERLTFATLRKSFDYIKEHFNEILPIVSNFLVLSVGNTLYLLLFSQLNIYSYVAITLVFPWLRIATQFILAWAQANAISITQAIGRKQASHVPLIVLTCIKLGMIMAGVVAIALYTFSLSAKWIYPKVDAQTYIALATLMPLYVIIPLVRTFNTISGNTLRALGKSVQVLKIHFFIQWLVVLPLCAAFILLFKLPAVWAFALLPAEEIIKAYPFYRLLRCTVTSKPFNPADK